MNDRLMQAMTATDYADFYLHQVGCFRRCLFVRLLFAQKTSERICMKFSGKVGNGPMNK